MAEKQYIEREAVVRLLCKEALQEYNLQRYGEARGVVSAKESVNRFPAADVAPVVHAEWNEGEYPFCNVCMECGLVIDRTCIKNNSGKLNYCPNCGAKMDGGKA